MKELVGQAEVEVEKEVEVEVDGEVGRVWRKRRKSCEEEV